jgi:hypothetical protein
MTKYKPCENLIDYFNHTLKDEEQTLFEVHLANCHECRGELEELNLLTADLPFSAEMVKPNEGMKVRILSAVFEEGEATQPQPEKIEAHEEPAQKKVVKRPISRWFLPLLAASLLLSLSANAYLYLKQPDQDIGYVPDEGTDEIVKQVQLAVSEGYEGNAEAAMIRKANGMALVVQANNLKPLTGNEAYQVWLIDEAGEKFRAGTFRTNSEGNGAVSYSIDYQGDHNWTTIAVTLEPTPDSKQPKGDIVLASQL